jgi:hypothetical protein
MKKQINYPSHKRHYIIITLVCVVLLALIATIIYFAHNQQQLDNLRKDIQSTHSSLGVIAHDLEKQTNTTWSDQSECYLTKPRLFGDDYKYDCDVHYITEINSTTIDYFQQITGRTMINGAKADFTTPWTNATGEFTSSATTIAIEHDSGIEKNCSLEYSYERANGQIEGWLTCHYSLTKAQFDAVSGVLPAGNDRT